MRIVRFLDPAEPGCLGRLLRLGAVLAAVATCALALLGVRAWRSESVRYTVTGVVSEMNAYRLALPLSVALVDDYPGSNWHYYRLKARNLRRVGRVEESLAVYDDAVAAMPNEWWAHSHRCFYHALYGDVASVLDSCDRQIELGSTEPDVAYDRRAIARALLGDREGAIADLRTALEAMRELTPDDWRIAVRERWLQALLDGQDPLTADEIREERTHY
jgi:tetratricopeptide (TPR) repeat protein